MESRRGGEAPLILRRGGAKPLPQNFSDLGLRLLESGLLEHLDVPPSTCALVEGPGGGSSENFGVQHVDDILKASPTTACPFLQTMGFV